MSFQKSLTLHSILKHRQREEFVGREEQVTVFRENLVLPLNDDLRRFIFNISGQGGVGKTWLLRRFRHFAESTDAVIGWVDDTEEGIPEVLGEFASQIEKQGHSLKTFNESYKLYRQRCQELDADPDAPPGVSAFVGHTLAKAGLHLARRIPVGGVVLDFVDDEAFATQVSEWASYVAGKLKNKDEVRLIHEPVEVLTPLFLDDIQDVAKNNLIALFFDTYEVTGDYLDTWLRDILDERHGTVPANILLGIAGREQLDKNHWGQYEGILARLPLEPYSEQEAIDYLARRSIVDKNVVDVILKLSGRLPLLVATLAAETPHDPLQVGDPSGTAVERFLKWVNDSKKRKLAIDAALPRRLNQDVVALLVREQDADLLFSWLKDTPFIEERANGWVYHNVVREQMLRQKHVQSPQSWSDLHKSLADYYEKLRDSMELKETEEKENPTWQNYTSDALYHRLCQDPYKYRALALNGFLEAFEVNKSFAVRWTETMLQAGKDGNSSDIQEWGEQLNKGVKAYQEKEFSDAVQIFSRLLGHLDIENKWRPIALKCRGDIYVSMELYDNALADFTTAIELDSNYPWAIFSRAQTYSSLGLYGEAIADYDRAIALDSKELAFLFGRGESFFWQNNYSQALADFDRYINISSDTDPFFALVLFRRGQIYRQTARHEEALLDFNRALPLSSRITHEGQKELGLTLLALHQYPQAMDAFIKALTDESACVHCWESLIDAYLGLHSRDEIPTLMEKLNIPTDKKSLMLVCKAEALLGKNFPDEALVNLEQAIAIDENNHIAFADRGELFTDMKTYDQALTDFNKSILLDPNNVNYLCRRGRVYLITQEFSSALTDFNKAIELDDNNGRAYALRSETYRLTDQPDLGLLDCTRSIELGYKPAWVYQTRGSIFLAVKRYNDSLVDFNKGIELDSNDAELYAKRGENYFLLKQYAKALVDFDHAISLDPSHHWSHEKRGETLFRLRRYEEAILSFTNAHNTSPTCMGCIANRGHIYEILGQYLEALADFKNILELDVDNAWAYGHIGDTYRLMGQYDNALANLSRSIDLKSDQSWVFIIRGLTYKELNRYDEALIDLTHAIELDPKEKNTWENLAVIYLKQGNYEQSIFTFQKLISLSSRTAWYHTSLISALKRVNRNDEAERHIKLARPLTEKENEYNRACFEAVCGNLEEALRLLKIALDQKQRTIEGAQQDPDFDFIREDPQFKELMRLQ